MSLPPLLQDHIGTLRSQGHDIEVKVAKEICIIFKNFSIPDNIWDRNKTDLLIIAYPTYPNAKLDMFWVDPPLNLKSGKPANAVTTESQCEKNLAEIQLACSILESCN